MGRGSLEGDEERMGPAIEATRDMEIAQLDEWMRKTLGTMNVEQRYATRLAFLAGTHMMGLKTDGPGFITNARECFNRIFLNAQQDGSLGALTQCDIDYDTVYEDTPTDVE